MVLLLTGYHADFDLLRACGIDIDEASGVPLHDPSTLESTSVPGVFFAGGVLAGKDTAPIFIENGRFHGERIVKSALPNDSSDPIGRWKPGGDATCDLRGSRLET